MSFLNGAFEDDNGGTSITRIIFTVGALAIIFVWTWLSLKKGEIINLQIKDLGFLSLFFGGKLGNKVLEVIEYIKTNGKE